MTDGLIAHQRISRTKLQRAKQFREEPTPTEQLLWQRLRGSKLDGFHFRRQQIIDGLIADFYCHTVRLVIELDGEIHDEQIDYDRERDRVLAARGIQVLRFSNTQVEKSLAVVVESIRASARSRLAHAPLPFREGAGG